MKEEKIIEYLKECNFWGNENLYFYTQAPQSVSNQANVYGLDVVSIKYYLVNKNENGIGIIPFDLTGKSIKELIKFIPQSNIKEVYTEKYKFLFLFSGTRMILKTTEDKVIELEYFGKENGNIQATNMYKLASLYQK